MTSSKLPVNQT